VVHGVPLDGRGEGEEVLSVEVDVDAVRQWREDFPVLADRRI